MLLTDLDLQKRELRKRFKELRESLSSAVRRSADFAMTARFLSLREYRESETLLCYVSSAIECSTGGIIKRALIDKKRVAVPKCRPDTHEMDFFVITSAADLTGEFYGIPEPDENRCERLSSFEGALCLVPGLAFDKSGFRLGFGGGYYDRFLRDFPGKTVALCYFDCVAGELPRCEFDLPVSCVITEKTIIKTD